MNFGYKGIANYYRLNIESAFKMFSLNQKDIIFIDVRDSKEWEDGIIPNSKTISLENLEKELINLNKDFHYVLVCNYGNKSSIAANSMFKNGFNNVYNLQGGMLEWNTQKYPIHKLSHNL